ncbi:MAG: hypothetical protein NC102_05045 [Clostridium sp.]|nr:hypothetical protein [Clostridium sp.]
MTVIIPAEGIDYNNVDEVCAYQSLLCEIYECEDGFNFRAKDTPTIREISHQCLSWLSEVRILIESILRGTSSSSNLGDIPRLLQSYGLFYHIGHGVSCFDFLREVKLKTADRWAKGDKSISQTDVALLLLSETDRNIHNLEERYAKYAIKAMSSWLDELTKYGDFKNIPKSETYRRLSYLLNADLSTYLSKKDEAKTKAQWVSSYTMAEEQIDSADTDILWAYADFIASIPFANTKEYERNDSMWAQILAKIASRPDTHPYFVKAIELTMA